LTAEQRLKVARAFWLDAEATDVEIQAVLAIAQHTKVRPKFILCLDPDRKAKHLSGVFSLPDPIAARALAVYHLAEQTPLTSAIFSASAVRRHRRNLPPTGRAAKRRCGATHRRRRKTRSARSKRFSKNRDSPWRTSS